jgi:UTP--glucose-1-phosphate uridylyltransferase
MKKVTKAVIAAGGFGTRFLPQTKAMPKEMLPLVDKPIIQYVVEGLVQAGITNIIIVTGYSKRSIEDHFDSPVAELAAILSASGKHAQLEEVRNIADMANFAFVRSKKAFGNASPLLYAGYLLNDEPFVYCWADEFVEAQPLHVSQMMQVYEQTQASVVPCIKITQDDEFNRYGIIAGQPRQDDPQLIQLQTIVEKPGRQNAPSDLANVGGYILTTDILPYVDRAIEMYSGEGEFKIQTVIQMMIDEGHPYVAYQIQNGVFRDAGNKLEYLKTVFDFALRRDDIGPELKEYLRSKLQG